MRRLIAISFALAAAVTSARADLTADVRKLIADDKGTARALVGVQVVKLGTTRELDQVVVDVDADKPLIPASNLKVITTALALDTLGPDFRFQTRLVTDGSDLALVGDGDPSFGDSQYLQPRGWTMRTVYERWADELKKAGVTRVANVRVDDSIFESTFMHAEWPRDQQQKWYEAQVAGVNFNANCLDVFATRQGGTAVVRTEPATNYVQLQNTLKVGATHSLDLTRELGTNKVIVRGTINASNAEAFRVTIDDPPAYAGTVLAETLVSRGIVVTGDVVRDRTIRANADKWRPVAVNETPLLEVLDRTNKESINLYAECVGKRAAAKLTGEPGSWKSLAAVQRTFMATVGAPADAYTFDDGSGMSRGNAVAPAAFVATLSHMFHGPTREAYVATFAVGGVDGTLDKRFQDPSIRGRVFAKSGYVEGVRTLSGYLKTKAGNWYAFSILMNKAPGSAKTVQEQIVRAVDNAD